MYTRSRQSQNFPNTPQRNQQQQGGQGFQQGQNNYQPQGGFQGTPGNQQQNAFKQQAPQFKQQNQPQVQGQQQQVRQQTPQQQQPPVTPQSQKQVKSILKTPITPAAPNQTTGNQIQNQNAPVTQNQNASVSETQQNVKNGTTEAMDSENGKSEAPRWRRRMPGVKVNRKLRKARMNQRLRKTLQPKNAIMVLHEMAPGVQFVFPEQPAGLQSSMFVAHVNVGGNIFVGQGLSKPLARQAAAENALKAILLEKMTAAAMKSATESVETKPEPEVQLNDDGTPMETSSEGQEGQEQDEIPWSSIASFALYKLFLEWQNQGTVVLVPKPGSVASPGRVKKDAKASSVNKELPPNPSSIQPVMLLNQMRPGVTYVEICRQGTPPNTMFTIGVEVDGQQYTGSAKNKKDAKKNAARAALQGVFNVTYPEEQNTGDDVGMTEACH